MELSTLYHFANKLGINAYAIVYVYDNTKHDIMHRSKSVDQARRRAFQTTQRIALEVLQADASRA